MVAKIKLYKDYSCEDLKICFRPEGSYILSIQYLGYYFKTINICLN